MKFDELFGIEARLNGVNWDQVKLAIEAGEDMNERDEHGSPYSWKFGKCPQDVIELAIENGIKIDSMLVTQLVQAGNILALKALLNKGCDLNLSPEVIEDFSTMGGHAMELVPFMGLAKRYDGTDDEYSEIAKLLIENSVDVNAQDSSGRTALFNAAIEDNIPLIEFLIENGADIKHKSVDGKTASQVADKKAACKKLLK